MALMKLWIKGNQESTLEVLASKGLDARTEMNPSSRHPETIAYVSEENYSVIGEWFAETPALIPGYGFPDGTLLHYSVERKD